MNDTSDNKGGYVAKKEDIVAGLKDLLETDTTRTKMGKIWEVYAEIVALQQAGVSIKNIETRLNERGFDLQPGNLTSYLYQIRKKKGIEKAVAVAPAPGVPRVKKVKTPPAGGAVQAVTPGAKQAMAAIVEKKKVDNPLTKPVGFEYKGTRDEKDMF